MPVAAFDTLQYVKRLRQAGIPEDRAEAQTAALAEALASGIQNLATKQDIQEVRHEIRQELTQLRQETKHEIEQLRQEMKTDIQALDAKFTEREARVRGELLLIRWMLGATFAGVVSLIIRLFFFKLI
jgi:hypothetical protein